MALFGSFFGFVVGVVVLVVKVNTQNEDLEGSPSHGLFWTATAFFWANFLAIVAQFGPLRLC